MLTSEVRYMLTHCHQIQRNKQIQQHVHCFHCISIHLGSSSTAGDTSSFGITVSFVRTKTAGATCSFDIAPWFSHTK